MENCASFSSFFHSFDDVLLRLCGSARYVSQSEANNRQLVLVLVLFLERHS